MLLNILMEIVMCLCFSNQEEDISKHMNANH